VANPERPYTLNWQGFPYAEKGEGSPSYSLMPGQQRCQRLYWIPWGEDSEAIPKAYRAFAGSTTRVSIAGYRAAKLSFVGTATGGTFTCTLNGTTTSGIAYNATAYTVQVALQAILVGTKVSGPSGGPYLISFTGIPATSFTANGSGLTGTVTPAITTYGASYLSRNVPHPHPNFSPLMHCEGFSQVQGSRPIGTPSQDNVKTGCFEEALVTANYWVPPYEIEKDSVVLGADGYPDESTFKRYISGTRKPIGKLQTIPKYGPLVWNDGTPADNTATVPLFEQDVSVTWHQIPIAAIPWDFINELYGKTNASEFGSETSIIGLYPAETLVMGSAEPTYYRQSTGDWAADLTYRLRYYPNGANKFLRIRKGYAPKWDFVWFDAAKTKPLFESADYSMLLRPV
jgi:hypothetical protein